MVAYTPQLCLPYFEAGDSPCLNTGTVCDPSTVWCDLINLVEAQLDSADTVVNRTARAIPMASISYDPATPVVINGVIPFDIVNLDTDNMVDLSVTAGIVPVRNGVYGITARVMIAPVLTNDFPQIEIHIGNEQAPEQGGGLDIGPVRAVTRGFNTAQWIFLSSAWEFNDLTPSPRTISLVSTYLSGSVLDAHLDVFWHSEID
jgi:hypothetical protein